MLDLGTGSGILALAGSAVRRAARVRVGQRPARRPHRAGKRAPQRHQRAAVRFARADLPDWRPRRRTWPVVTANLFSELLIRLMPEVIAPAVAPRGDLILSGVLATQADEVVAAVRAAGLTLVTIKRAGAGARSTAGGISSAPWFRSSGTAARAR